MPIFLDRHDVVEFSAEEVAKLHVKDLEVQGKYGVKFLTYWYDAERRTTFCLVDAPDKETADKVHAEAHGHVANEMIAVDLSAVEAFLGRIQDPPSAKTMPIDDSAFRAIMFTDIVGSTEMTAQLGDTMAARICDIAQADAILVSREVRDACAGVDLGFAPAGSEKLKGFSEPVQLFSLAH